MEIVRNQVIVGQTLTLDDKHYMGCQLRQCKLVYSGGDCLWTETMFDNCQIMLAGAAQRTATLLSGFGMLPPSGTNPPPGGFGFPKKPDGKVQ